MSYVTSSIAKNKIQRGLLQIIRGYPSDKEKQKIWQYFDSSCAYCNCEIEQGSRTGHLDHLIAISDGGTNDMHNFVLACSICNGDEKREQKWLDFLLFKCRDLPTPIFEQRLAKINNWQQQSSNIQLDQEMLQEIGQIIVQAKQDFDNAVLKMRTLKQKINT